MVEQIGTWVWGRRLSAELAPGRASYLSADASIGEWPGTMRMITVEAAGRPGTWRAMLKDIGTALQRARLHGFTEREVQDARTALTADAEEAVQREVTRPAREVLRQLNGDVTRGSRTMSAAQRLALFQRLLPGIPAREGSDTFTAALDPKNGILIAELPATDGVPRQAEVLILGRAPPSLQPGKAAPLS